MPARSPRIAVYLPKHVAATVRRLAAMRGVSSSAVVRDFLIETEPVLQRIANMLDLAARTDKEALKEWAETLEAAQNSIELDAVGVMAKADHMHQQLLKLKKPGRPPAGGERGSTIGAARRPRRTSRGH
jgi:hypothetical protein